jgi:hypothetical protein
MNAEEGSGKFVELQKTDFNNDDSEDDLEIPTVGEELIDGEEENEEILIQRCVLIILRVISLRSEKIRIKIPNNFKRYFPTHYHRSARNENILNIIKIIFKIY